MPATFTIAQPPPPDCSHTLVTNPESPGVFLATMTAADTSVAGFILSLQSGVDLYMVNVDQDGTTIGPATTRTKVPATNGVGTFRFRLIDQNGGLVPAGTVPLESVIDQVGCRVGVETDSVLITEQPCNHTFTVEKMADNLFELTVGSDNPDATGFQIINPYNSVIRFDPLTLGDLIHVPNTQPLNKVQFSLVYRSNGTKVEDGAYLLLSGMVVPDGTGNNLCEGDTNIEQAVAKVTTTPLPAENPCPRFGYKIGYPLVYPSHVEIPFIMDWEGLGQGPFKGLDLRGHNHVLTLDDFPNLNVIGNEIVIFVKQHNTPGALPCSEVTQIVPHKIVLDSGGQQQEPQDQPQGTCSRFAEIVKYRFQYYPNKREVTFRDVIHPTFSLLTPEETQFVQISFHVTNARYPLRPLSVDNRISVGWRNPDKLRWETVQQFVIPKGDEYAVRFDYAEHNTAYTDTGAPISFAMEGIPKVTSYLGRGEMWMHIKLQAFREDPRINPNAVGCGVPTSGAMFYDNFDQR